ncbi:hypothetical protein C8Q73DRAFT_390422 [Cubamyces lactineus]|nr:hypothetical protein C8Q73DRAFT_390422 [Cubamyces lactineus]
MSEIYLNNTFGAMLLSVVLTGCMYGVTTTQTYTYFVMSGSATDNKYLRMLIFFLWVLDTFHTGVITGAAYTYLVTDFGNLLAASRPTWTVFPATVICSGLNNGLVRGVLCYRVWRLSGSNWLLLIAFGTPVLVTMASTFAYAIVGSIHIKTWLDLYKISWLLVFSFAWSMAADVIISASLYALLAVRKTGFPSSDNIIRKLIIYSVNTGAVSSLCALLCLVTYVTMQQYFVFMPFYCLYPKLILNCLLATLNGRPALKGQLASTMAPKSDTVRPLVVETMAHEDVDCHEESFDRTSIINIGHAPHTAKISSCLQSSRARLETLDVSAV